MEDSGDQQTGWRDSLPELVFFLFIIVLFLVAVGWFVYFSMKAIENPEEDSAEEVVAETVEETVEEVGARDPVQVEFPYFDPGRVLNNPECRVRVAQAASVDTAVVLLPFAGGGRFAVVDATGILHAGELSFWPATFEVAKRRNGSVLTAFGHLTGEKSAEGSETGSGLCASSLMASLFSGTTALGTLALPVTAPPIIWWSRLEKMLRGW